jgi:hypothetical protein
LTTGLGEVFWGAKGPTKIVFTTELATPEASEEIKDEFVLIQGIVPVAVVEGPVTPGLGTDAGPVAGDVPYSTLGFLVPTCVSSTVTDPVPSTIGPGTAGGLIDAWTSGCCATSKESGTFELPGLVWWPVTLWISGVWDRRATVFWGAVEVGGGEGLDADTAGGTKTDADGCSSLAATESTPESITSVLAELFLASTSSTLVKSISQACIHTGHLGQCR